MGGRASGETDGPPCRTELGRPPPHIQRPGALLRPMLDHMVRPAGDTERCACGHVLPSGTCREVSPRTWVFRKTTRANCCCERRRRVDDGSSLAGEAVRHRGKGTEQSSSGQASPRSGMAWGGGQEEKNRREKGVQKRGPHDKHERLWGSFYTATGKLAPARLACSSMPTSSQHGLIQTALVVPSRPPAHTPKSPPPCETDQE